MSEIKIGDQVRLKSGGPVMTVEEESKDQFGFRLGCVWFDKDKVKHKGFVASTLVKVEQEADNNV